MYITAYFTNAWTPITWLTPSISVIKLSDDSVVDSWTMSEISWGYYKYNFTTFDSSTEYLYTIDWWSALNNADRYKSWVTSLEVDNDAIATAVWNKDVSWYTTDNWSAWYELQQWGWGGLTPEESEAILRVDVPVSSVGLQKNVFSSKEFKREDDKKLKKLLDDRLKETETTILEGVDSKWIKELIIDNKKTVTTWINNITDDLNKTWSELKENIQQAQAKLESSINETHVKEELVEIKEDIDIISKDLQDDLDTIKKDNIAIKDSIDKKLEKKDLNKINNLLVDIKNK